jgi:hypothetical protein
MNQCAHGGLLVDATKPIPADPTELHSAGLPALGCSRLRCSRCSADVRHATAVGPARSDLDAADLAGLYVLPALDRSPLLRAGMAHWRFYLCKCSQRLETSTHTCDELDTDVPALYDDRESGDTPPSLQWRCQGHPLVTLPHDLGGTVVASHEELRAVALRAMRGLWPPHVTALEAHAGAWLALLYARLQPAEGAVLTAAALSCLEDPAPRTRALALRFLYRRPGAEARARLVELLDQRRALFAGVPDEFTEVSGDATLEHTAWRIVGPLLAAPGRARELARAALEAGTASAAIREQLQRHDRKWLDERARKEKERLAALAPRALDDPRLQAVLDEPALREPLAASDCPLGRFLRASGALAHDHYEEVTYTDWDGTPVGRGNGERLRAAIPADPALPFSELAPLVERGPRARELVARHPSTPTAVLEKLATDADGEVCRAARSRLGSR